MFLGGNKAGETFYYYYYYYYLLCYAHYFKIELTFLRFLLNGITQRFFFFRLYILYLDILYIYIYYIIILLNCLEYHEEVFKLLLFLQNRKSFKCNFIIFVIVKADPSPRSFFICLFLNKYLIVLVLLGGILINAQRLQFGAEVRFLQFFLILLIKLSYYCFYCFMYYTYSYIKIDYWAIKCI